MEHRIGSLSGPGGSQGDFRLPEATGNLLHGSCVGWTPSIPLNMTSENQLIYLMNHTVNGRNPVNSSVEVGSLSHYSQGFIPSRWFSPSSFKDHMGPTTKPGKALWTSTSSKVSGRGYGDKSMQASCFFFKHKIKFKVLSLDLIRPRHLWDMSLMLSAVRKLMTPREVFPGWRGEIDRFI